jgi:hypothetical protein
LICQLHLPEGRGNNTGGSLEDEELETAVELLLSTKDEMYGTCSTEMGTAVDKKFILHAGRIVKVLSFLDEDFKQNPEFIKCAGMIFYCHCLKILREPFLQFFQELNFCITNSKFL